MDTKLVRLARNLDAKLFTNDYNLGKIAELQRVNHVNLHELAKSLRTMLLPGEVIALKIVREGKDKGQGVGYLPDGTMVVVGHAQSFIGRMVDAEVQSHVQTGAGVIVFADVREIKPAVPQTTVPRNTSDAGRCELDCGLGRVPRTFPSPLWRRETRHLLTNPPFFPKAFCFLANPARYKQYHRSIFAGAIADWLHNLANCSSKLQPGFPEESLWKEHAYLCRRFPGEDMERYRRIFDEYLAGKKWP